MATATTPTTTQAKPADAMQEAAERSKALAVRKVGSAIYDRIADPVAFIQGMGVSFAQSGMFGKLTVAQGQTLAFIFMAKRIDPIDFARRNDIIEGKIAMRSAAMLSDFRSEKGGTYEIVERSAMRAAIKLTYKRQTYVSEITWQQAMQEQYPWTGDANYGKVPKFNKDGSVNPKALKTTWRTERGRMQMLWNRAVSDGINTDCPEVKYGLYTADELDGVDSDSDEGFLDADYSVSTSEFTPVTDAAGEVIDADVEAVDEPPFEAEAEAEVVVDTEAQQAAERAKVTEAIAKEAPTAEEREGLATDEQREQMQVHVRELAEVDERWRGESAKSLWSQLIGRFGAARAADLSHEHAGRVVSWLGKEVTKLRTQKEQNDWANAQVGSKGNG